MNDWSHESNTLNERDSNVLTIINEEKLTKFTFDGLKRRLGIHPETLSRILSRLEDGGIIEKGLDGYIVTSKATEYIDANLPSNTTSILLIHSLLPPNIPVHQMISDLVGKWFGVLRWLGYTENNGGITLKWITEDGATQIEAQFSDSSLSILAKPLTEKDMNSAIKASYKLMEYISRLYSRPTKARNIAYFTSFGSPIMAA